MEKGSMLVLAIIATLILSMILVAGLTVSTTEVNTTQNYYLNKMSFYKAVEGVEIVTEKIRNEPEPDVIAVRSSDYLENVGGLSREFITGTLEDVQQRQQQNISKFEGFDPPPLPAISLGPTTGVLPVIWYVPITAKVQAGRKTAYTEVEAGIYSILITGY